MNDWHHQYFEPFCRKLWLLVLLLYVVPVMAAPIDVSKISAESMVVNLHEQMPNLMRMVTALAYVMGMYLIIYGVVGLKHMGEMRTQMSVEHSARGPLILITIGALLLYFPSTVQMGMSTFWVNPTPYGYETSETDQWTEFINICFTIVQFVGVVSFIRGLMILKQLSGHGGQQGTFGRGMTHIIGGIFCVNIYQFVQTVFGTLLGIQIF